MAEIVPTNISAVGVVYTAAQLEEAKLFAVADRVAKLFHAGTLPMISNAGGAVLRDYIKKASIRLKTLERRRAYARAFGWAQSDTTDVRPNRHFDALWMRFIGEVSEFVEGSSHAPPARDAPPASPPGIGRRQFAEAARELAQNLSTVGDETLQQAASRLQIAIKNTTQLLSQPDIRKAFGANTMWQLIERVSAAELGGKANTVRHRTLATTGNAIIAWLAKHAETVSVSQVNAPSITASLPGLASNVETWLAANGAD